MNMNKKQLRNQASFSAVLSLGDGRTVHEIVHYFNKDMEEIGYIGFSENVTVFNPPRTWSESVLSDYIIREVV